MCVQVHVTVNACVCGSQARILDVFLYLSPFIFFCFVLCILRQCLFTEPEVHVSIRLSVKQPLGSTFVYTPVLGLQTPMAAPDFDMGGGDQNAVSTRLCSKCFTH